MGVATDITERKKAQEAREDLLAIVAHDLRTPITRLRLRAEFVDDDEQRRETRQQPGTCAAARHGRRRRRGRALTTGAPASTKRRASNRFCPRICRANPERSSSALEPTAPPATTTMPARMR